MSGGGDQWTDGWIDKYPYKNVSCEICLFTYEVDLFLNDLFLMYEWKNANDIHADVTFLHSNILNIKCANVEAKESTSKKRLTSH